ncbi:isocitrate dehydrogenase kinase/phosphatase-domain containing protein [Escherichia coli]
MAIGCQKHAKTESYREYLVYLQGCNEQFIEAPGIRGMVMLVFTLPGFDRVFKVIKDKFAPQKEMSAAHVRACYQLVKEHDRVGRMADTQEFENFVLEKRHILPALMELLLQEAAEKITDLGEQICNSPSLYRAADGAAQSGWNKWKVSSCAETPLKNTVTLFASLPLLTFFLATCCLKTVSPVHGRVGFIIR